MRCPYRKRVAIVRREFLQQVGAETMAPHFVAGTLLLPATHSSPTLAASVRSAVAFTAREPRFPDATCGAHLDAGIASRLPEQLASRFGVTHTTLPAAHSARATTLPAAHSARATTCTILTRVV